MKRNRLGLRAQPRQRRISGYEYDNYENEDNDANPHDVDSEGEEEPVEIDPVEQERLYELESGMNIL